MSGVRVPIEDRIDQLSRLALAVILIITLAMISLPKSQGKRPREGVRKAETPHLMARCRAVATTKVLTTRAEQRTGAI
jgi:hypothetical protein